MPGNFLAWFWKEWDNAVRGFMFFLGCALTVNGVLYGGLYLKASLQAAHPLTKTEYRAVVLDFGKRMDVAFGGSSQDRRKKEKPNCEAGEAGR